MPKKVYRNAIIVFSFFLLSMFYIILYLREGLLLVGSDRMFHLERMEEAYQVLNHGHILSYISTFSFARIGQAVGTFYPSINLNIYALIHLIIKDNVSAFYIFIFIEQFIGLLVAYLSGKVLLKTRKSAYIFAIILRFSTYVLYNDFARCDVGESWALIFVPMSLAGFYMIINNDSKGKYVLSLGLILELSCHILTTLITVGFIVVCFIIYFLINSISKQIFYNLLLAAILFVLGSLYILVPIIDTMLKVNINKPQINALGSYGVSITDIFGNSFNNTLALDSPNLGLPLAVILILGMIFYSKQSKLMQHIYLVAVVLVVMSVNLFPWQLFSKTPLAIIQFPWRLLVIAIVLLSVFLAKTIGNDIKKIGLLLSLILIMTAGSLASYKQFQKEHYHVLNSMESPTNGWGYLLNNDSVNRTKSKNLISSFSSRTLDYFPAKAIKNSNQIFDHKIIISSKEYSLKNNQIHSGYQSVTYDLDHLPVNGEKVILPFLVSDHNNYKVYADNKLVKFNTSTDSTIELTKPAGIGNIQYKVEFVTPLIWKISNYISSFFVISILILYFAGSSLKRMCRTY